MVFSVINSSNLLYQKKKSFLFVIKFPSNTKIVIKKVFGLVGLILFFVPIYYLFLLPVSLFLYSWINKMLVSHDNVIEEFKTKPIDEKQYFLNEFKEINKGLSLISKELKSNKNIFIWSTPLIKSFKENIQNVFVDIEDEMLSINENNPFEVAEISDDNIFDLASQNRVGVNGLETECIF